jgi:hypothetical protein
MIAGMGDFMLPKCLWTLGQVAGRHDHHNVCAWFMLCHAMVSDHASSTISDAHFLANKTVFPASFAIYHPPRNCGQPAADSAQELDVMSTNFVWLSILHSSQRPQINKSVLPKFLWARLLLAR